VFLRYSWGDKSFYKAIRLRGSHPKSHWGDLVRPKGARVPPNSPSGHIHSVPSGSDNKTRSRSISKRTMWGVRGGIWKDGTMNNLTQCLYACLTSLIIMSAIILFHAVIFYLMTNRLFMCKSPDILRHSRSCFLTAPNLYVQIRELGTKRLSQQRKTWSISRSSRSSCSEAGVRSWIIFSCPGVPRPIPGAPPFASGVPRLAFGASRLRSRSSD
jgi:hypothetical protein